MKILLSALVVVSMLSCQNNKENSGDSHKKQSVLTEKSPIDSLNTLIKQQPNESFHYFSRAKAYLTKNNYVPAIEDIKKALSIDSTNISYHLEYGNMLMLVNKTREAKEIWEKCAELEGDHSSCKLKLAELYLFVQDYKQAVTFANDVLREDATKDLAYFYKGISYAEMGDTTKALQNYQQALEHNPENIQILDALATLYAHKNNLLAIDYYRLIQKKRPNQSKAYFDEAYFHHQRQDWQKAISLYEKTLQINQNQKGVYYNLGYVYFMVGNNEIAIDNFNKAIELDNNYLDAYFARGYVFEILGNKAQAKNDYKKCILLNAKHNPAHIGLERLNE
ncbi:MAG: tetratricopeptide repeat protein [Flavobacteriales bacterium]|jgi:tetratricopeptide (TPR) repeat protein|nr:tetratricopeptide repeat protein [Flavobacteriales bacterium]